MTNNDNRNYCYSGTGTTFNSTCELKQAQCKAREEGKIMPVVDGLCEESCKHLSGLKCANEPKDPVCDSD
eukprot:gene19309-6567_t